MLRGRGARTPRRARTALVAILVPLSAGAAAGQASAATITVTRPCYVNVNPDKGAPITVLGRGFAPGDKIEVETAGGTSVFTSVTADHIGSFRAVTSGPLLLSAGPGTRTFALRANDSTSGVANLARTTVTMANLAVDTKPVLARPTQKVLWHFSGFQPGRTIWVHYLHKATVVNRMRFGTARGPCGTLKTRALFYPGGHPTLRRYSVVFDQLKRYTTSSRPRILTTLSFS